MAPPRKEVLLDLLWCPRCKKYLPIFCFGNDISTRLGFTVYCIECHHTNGRENYQRHQEDELERARKWRLDNPGYRQEHKQRNIDATRRDLRKSASKRRARQRGTAVIEALDPLANWFPGVLCGLCGLPVSREDAVGDHVIPLDREGPHTAENIQIAHRSGNAKKHTKLPEEYTRYLKKIGMTAVEACKAI